MDNELLISEEWQDKCLMVVIDPDGWDRKNYKWSWHREKITKQEFERRLMRSTCMFPHGLVNGDIWK